VKLTPYLSFNGNCEAAFKFYERVLAGKDLTVMTFENSPMADHVPANWRKKVMHARITLGDEVLMGSDPPPDRYEPIKGVSISLGIDKTDEAERIFLALAENGTVRMPIQKTFWASRFGMLVDQFGTPWMINCEEPAG
jgi:PhnB protein